MVFAPGTIQVDRASPVPLYYQLATRLEEAIEGGDLEAGRLIGNEITLAQQLGLSRPTVRRAIGYLVERGLLVRKRGVGTQVLHPHVRRPLELTSLFDDLTRGGQDPTTRVLALHSVTAPDLVARSLGIAEGSTVIVVERLREAAGNPLAVLRNYLPAGLVELSAERLEAGGLYQLMRSAGIRLHVATQTVGARTAGRAEARLLDERPGAALLTMQRTTYDQTGRAVEYGTHYYRASMYSFELVLSAR